MSKKKRHFNSRYYRGHTLGGDWNVNNIWVKTDRNGIKVVEVVGFRDIKILDFPNEVPIRGMLPMVKLIVKKLGLKVPKDYFE